MQRIAHGIGARAVVSGVDDGIWSSQRWDKSRCEGADAKEQRTQKTEKFLAFFEFFALLSVNFAHPREDFFTIPMPNREWAQM
jgi:hypothetical protein